MILTMNTQAPEDASQADRDAAVDGGGLCDIRESDKSSVMSLWDHLEALRWVVVKSLVTVAITSTFCMLYASFLAELLQRPLAAVIPPVELVFAAPLDAFVSRIRLGLLGGVVAASPAILTFIWGFVTPALHARERRVARAAIGCGSAMFLLGIVFAYRLLYFGLPAVVQMGLGGARHLWSLQSYFSFCFRFLLAFGLIFELPVMLVALGRIGIIHADLLRRVRRYVVVGIFVAAAILTPPDALTQTLLALPLIVLYEVSIILVSLMQRRGKRI